jgi:hypothetical protein
MTCRTARSARARRPHRPAGDDVTQYYGLSFGGIYGTDAHGTDPTLSQPAQRRRRSDRGLARLSASATCSPHAAHEQAVAGNGGPGLEASTESWPRRTPRSPTRSRGDRHPAQPVGRDLVRPAGGPEPYAPLLALAPRRCERVLYQVAFGDGTVRTSPAQHRARGDLFDVTTYYRNDRTPPADRNPHVPGGPDGVRPGRWGSCSSRRSRDRSDHRPHGPGGVFETPIANEDNLQCLHYPHPQTARRPSRQGGRGVPAAPRGPAVRRRPRAPAGGGTGVRRRRPVRCRRPAAARAPPCCGADGGGGRRAAPQKT